jgi:hypothetical protein
MTDQDENLTDHVGSREKYIGFLQGQFSAGRLSRAEFMKLMAEFDALTATKRTQTYAVISTVAGAVSAIAAAVSAFFAYLGSVAHH